MFVWQESLSCGRFGGGGWSLGCSRPPPGPRRQEPGGSAGRLRVWGIVAWSSAEPCRRRGPQDSPPPQEQTRGFGEIRPLGGAVVVRVPESLGVKVMCEICKMPDVGPTHNSWFPGVFVSLLAAAAARYLWLCVCPKERVKLAALRAHNPFYYQASGEHIQALCAHSPLFGCSCRCNANVYVWHAWIFPAGTQRCLLAPQNWISPVCAFF